MSNETIATKNTQEHQLLRNLGFSEPFELDGRSSISDLIPLDKRCGIYVLHFTNGDCYVGQAVDVTRRYTQHRQTFEDIQLISFKVVQRKKLNREEKRIIETLENEDVVLRNIVFTSILRGESDFDEIMSLDDQEIWLEDLSFIDDRGPRRTIPALRSKTERAYNRFKKQPLAEPIKGFLRYYIAQSLPAYKRSEIHYWSISCMPQKNVPVRININWQEVLAVYAYSNNPEVRFQMAKSPIDKQPLKVRARFLYRNRSASRFNFRYRTGGQDQTRFVVPLDKALAFLNEPSVLAATRLFNLRLMRKGMSNYGRSHCIQLAGELIGDAASAE